MGKSASPSFKPPVSAPTEPPVEKADAPELSADAEEREDEWIEQPWLPPLLTRRVALPTAFFAVLFAVVVGLSGGGAGPITLGLQIGLAALLVVLTATDLLVQRLPDALVLPAYPIALLATIGATLAGEVSWHQVLVAAACMAGAWLLFYGIAFFTGGLGFGDVKLAGLIGLVLGLQGIGNAIAGTFMLPCLCAVPVLLVLLARDIGRKTGVPFGPLLAIGTILALILHQNVTDTYTVLSWKF